MKYYIQDTRSYVGNCAIWWRSEGKGYTCHIEEAGEFDEDEARNIERSRKSDKAWPVDTVRAAASMMVDMQRLRRCPQL